MKETLKLLIKCNFQDFSTVTATRQNVRSKEIERDWELKKTLKVLIKSNFQDFSTVTVAKEHTRSKDGKRDWVLTTKVVNAGKIRRAFQPYKTRGPEGIHIRGRPGVVLDPLVGLLQGYIVVRHTAVEWRKDRVVFISVREKREHSS